MNGIYENWSFSTPMLQTRTYQMKKLNWKKIGSIYYNNMPRARN